MNGPTLPSQKPACDTWYNVTGPLTIHTMSPVEPTISSGTHLSRLFTPVTLTQPSAALAVFSSQSRAYITVTMAIYLLSNNLVDPYSIHPHREFFETLDSVFAEIPAKHLRALLQSCLANDRAAFEALLNISGVLKQPFAFKSLVEIGTSNNWLSISARGHEYLYHAVCMDLGEVVQKLLESGCHPDKPLRSGNNFYDHTTPIVTALERRQIRWFQLLLKHCDVKSSSQFQDPLIKCTYFNFFIQRRVI